MIDLNDANFEQYISTSDKTPILVDFWTLRCEACRCNAPIVDELSIEFKDRLRVGKLNVEYNPYTVGRYNIKLVPSIMVFWNGQVVLKLNGIQTRESVIDQLIDKKIIF